MNKHTKQFGDPEPPLDLAQQQDAAIRRQPSAVEPGAQFLARNGWQAGQIGDSLVHGEPWVFRLSWIWIRHPRLYDISTG